MRYLYLVVLVFAFGCSKSEEAAPAPAPAPAPVAEPTPAPKPAEPVAFNAVEAFNTTCATCHGTTGHGDGEAGKVLDPRPASFADPEFWKTRDRAHIMKVIKEGGASVGKSPLMVAWGGTFNDEQIGQLADHVMSFKPAE